MLKTILSLNLVLSALWVGYAWAENNPTKYADGKGYELVQPAQPTQDSGKIEVIEFFWEIFIAKNFLLQSNNW